MGFWKKVKKAFDVLNEVDGVTDTYSVPKLPRENVVFIMPNRTEEIIKGKENPTIDDILIHE